MTTVDISQLIEDVIEREGGFVNHPYDRGGPTNMGITLRTLAAWRGKVTTAWDVKNLTKEEAMEIYKSVYWEAPGFVKLYRDFCVASVLFDAAVHHGPTQAIKFLQQAVGTKTDGLLGPKTIAATDQLDDKSLIGRFSASRIQLIGQLITRDPRQAVFAEGWLEAGSKPNARGDVMDEVSRLVLVIGFLALSNLSTLGFLMYTLFKLDDWRYKYRELNQELTLKNKKR